MRVLSTQLETLNSQADFVLCTVSAVSSLSPQPTIALPLGVLLCNQVPARLLAKQTITYRFLTARQSLLGSRKTIRKFPEPWLNIILLSLKPSKRFIAEVLRPVSFHHTATLNGSTFFHPPFLSFFPPAKEKNVCFKIILR